MIFGSSIPIYVVTIEFSPLSTVDLTTNWYQLHNGVLSWCTHYVELKAILNYPYMIACFAQLLVYIQKIKMTCNIVKTRNRFISETVRARTVLTAFLNSWKTTILKRHWAIVVWTKGVVPFFLVFYVFCILQHF